MLPLLQILLTSCLLGITLLLVAWMAGALYYDVGKSAHTRWLLVGGWLMGTTGLAIFWHPSWQVCVLIGGFFLLFQCWWLQLKPSQDRNWAQNQKILSRIAINGEEIQIEAVRNTQYRTLEDYTPEYQIRKMRRSQLLGVDVLLCYWGSPWMCHPIFIFDFGAAGRICFSIEVRYRQGQKYSLLSSLYRQHELIYIVCDERDAILKRTLYGENEDCYLYRFQHPQPEGNWQLFKEYADGVNRLFHEPCWYNGLTANCTTTIYNQRQREMRWDWNLMFNGKLDQALYRLGRLDQHLPFEELKQQSWINELANQAPADDFGNFLRRELTGYRVQEV